MAASDVKLIPGGGGGGGGGGNCIVIVTLQWPLELALSFSL